MAVVFPDDLVEHGESRIVFVVMDGLGGLPDPETGKTELETANTPNLDRLARRSALGLIRPVAAGVAPGSGPGHLALFGYDPVRWVIGRGVLSALGVGFDLREGDVAVRLNFATADAEGRIVDRRAGRPSDEENRRLVEKLRAGVQPPRGIELFFESEKEHRAVMVLRGENLSAALSDTDPQETGVPPLHVRPLEAGAEETARVVQDLLDSAWKVLADEPRANALLARGFAAYERYPSMADRYKLRSRAIARYPMYRGVARLLGMEVEPAPASDAESVAVLADRFQEYDFHFVHFKAVDSRVRTGISRRRWRRSGDRPADPADRGPEAGRPRGDRGSFDAVALPGAFVAPGAGPHLFAVVPSGGGGDVRRETLSAGRTRDLPRGRVDVVRARARGSTGEVRGVAWKMWRPFSSAR